MHYHSIMPYISASLTSPRCFGKAMLKHQYSEGSFHTQVLQTCQQCRS